MLLANISICILRYGTNLRPVVVWCVVSPHLTLIFKCPRVWRNLLK
jgi:hypothetical protein